MPKLKFSVFFLLLMSAILAKADDLRGDTIDIGAYKLRIDLSDFNGQILYGDAGVTIKAKMNNVTGIHLDLLELTVDSVFVNTVNVPFTYNDTLLGINFSTALNIGDSAKLEIFYHGHPLQMSGDFGGFYWTSQYAFNIGVSFLADPHNYGKVWFPCFDNFSVRSTYEYYITTDATHKAFCGGILLDSASTNNTRLWHWKMNENIPSYLASVSVGPFVTLSDTVNVASGNIPIQIGAEVGDTAAVNHLFQHLHDDVHNLEKHWGPYRWERVGYCIVPFTAGAMEHATNISFMSYFLNQIDYECEQVVAHELSHHWFGDLVTCDNASEMWLNEGWACYNENLFFEDVYGADSAMKCLRVNHQLVQQTAHVDDEAYLPVSGVPTAQTYGTTVYKKGQDVIHTLRYYMGDSLFFSGVKGYINTYAHATASTVQMRDYLSQSSGINLTDYFTDWVQTPGFPHFSIEHKSIAGSGNSYTVHYQIRQRLRHAPHYYNNVPVTISYFNTDMTRVKEKVMVSGECTDHVTTLSFQPAYIAVDFDEDLQDAISDEWKMIKTPGQYNYTIGMMNVHVNAMQDSALLRVEHNWIPADAMFSPIPDLHLNNYRYWTVDGVFDSTFYATGSLSYDGRPGAHLDSVLLSNGEDSLVLLYRPDQNSEWTFADSAILNTGVSLVNLQGNFTFHLKKGEYAMANYDTRYPADSNTRVSCELKVGVNEIKQGQNFKVYPNPSTGYIDVSYEQNIFNKLEIFSLLGSKLVEQKIAPEQNMTELKMSNIAGGNYVVVLSAKNGGHFSKKIIKE